MLHDDLVRAVRATVLRVDAKAVAHAFVAALRPRRFEHWSSLASFAIARALPEHTFHATAGRRPCNVCGAFERVDVFESDQFATERRNGVLRTDSLRYTLYDLESFSRDARTEPADLDTEFFNVAMSRIANIPPESNVFAAEAALGVVFASRIERKRFLGALGICGILASPHRPGFWPTFVRFDDRALLDPTPYAYPVRWWEREHNLGLEALEAFGLARLLSQETRLAWT